jgi:hypothetical protein
MIYRKINNNLVKRSAKWTVLTACVFINFHGNVKAADDIQFNTDVLDIKDKENIDLSHFAKRGYIMPGDYIFKIKINENELEEQSISVYPDGEDGKDSKACFKPEVVKKLGFKEDSAKAFTSWHNSQCVDITALKGVEVNPDLSSGVLTISVPQAYLEYTNDNWVPSSMWDEGYPACWPTITSMLRPVRTRTAVTRTVSPVTVPSVPIWEHGVRVRTGKLIMTINPVKITVQVRNSGLGVGYISTEH